MDLNNIKPHGDIFELKNILVFFGNKNFNDDFINDLDIKKFLINQVHGNQLVRAETPAQTADAHWSDASKEMLFIRTADCLPIMISLNEGQKILSIHAGWKGVQQKIVSKAISTLNKLQKITKVDVWIGPHIQQPSFEIGEDVFEKIAYAHPWIFSSDYEFRNSKYYLNLKSLVKKEIESIGIDCCFRHISNTDTKIKSTFNSYRRDQSPDRNYSFIVRLN